MKANDLVAVNLKGLVNLARHAAQLKLHKTAIKSRQSGGFVSRFKGRGMEFDETRLYQPGDDIRSIDWRVTARSEKTYTKLFREERERPVFISVDDRSAMHFATRGVFKSVQAAKIAALLAWVAQQQGDRIGGQIFTDTVCTEIKPQNGKHGVLRFFNALLKPEAAKEQAVTFHQVIARLSQHARPGSLVYIISDFRGLNQQTENYLSKLARHCDVVMVMVYDPLESSLPAKGRYRFTDDNSDVVIDTGDRQQVMKYQEKFQQHWQQLENLSKKLQLRFIQCSTTENPAQSLR
jgi:uncharacterized protein (DUF58 family)